MTITNPMTKKPINKRAKTTPKPAPKQRKAPPAMEQRSSNTKKKAVALSINDKPTSRASSVTYSEVYAGTMLMRRKEGSHYVAPMYVGVDTLSLVGRLQRAFADADRLKPPVGAVVVDGVTYPKIDGKWYVWKRPREVYELTLREMGLSDNEIFFRMSVQRLESAKSDLRAAFDFIPMPPEAWEQYLKWQYTFLDEARKKKDTVREAIVLRRVRALIDAITARDHHLECWQKAKV